jgi:hypothetical protein
MKKCDRCSNTATRYANNKELDKLEHMCEIHYSKWNPQTAQIQKEKIKQCVLCGTLTDNPIKHHVCYFPEMIQVVCKSCHSGIHQGKKYPDSNLFYKK